MGSNTTGSRSGSGKLKTLDCDTSVSVNDLVYLSSIDVNTALEAVDNNSPTPVIGIVIQKPTSESCVVLLRGFIQEVATQGRLFVGTDGKLTGTVPATGYLQEMGISFGDGDIDLLPNPRRVKRS